MGARPVIGLADAFLDEAEMYEASLRHEGFDVRMITTVDVVVAAAQVHAIHRCRELLDSEAPLEEVLAAVPRASDASWIEAKRAK